MIDLGAWAHEDYRVPVKETEQDPDGQGTLQPEGGQPPIGV